MFTLRRREAGGAGTGSDRLLRIPLIRNPYDDLPSLRILITASESRTPVTGSGTVLIIAKSEQILPLTESDPQTPLRKVLVIDDEETVRTALTASIETFDGFEVDTAEDGEIGLGMISAERYDVVQVDLMMPVIDGFEVLRQLRGMNDDSRPDRVILVSGMVDPVLQANVREFGGDAILGKPFRLDDLRRLLVDELDPI